MGKKEMTCDCEIIHEDAVNEVNKQMPTTDIINNLADLFKVLADSTRMNIMWALDKRELCVCDIAVLLNMTKSAVSHQLRVLKNNNLVKSRREGKNIFYSFKDMHIKQIFVMAVEHLEEGL